MEGKQGILWQQRWLACIGISPLQACDCETVPLMPAEGAKNIFLYCTGLGPPTEGKQGILWQQSWLIIQQMETVIAF